MQKKSQKEKAVVDISSYNDKIYITYEDGTKQNAVFDWYFYIENKDTQRVFEQYRGQFSRVAQGKEYTRIYADAYNTRTSLAPRLHAAGIQTYEADFTMEERYKFDYKPNIATDIPVLYFDIETDDRERRIMIGRDYILSLFAIDSHGNEAMFVLEDMTPEAEKRFLTDIAALFKKYTIIAGWNIKGFDVPYLRERCKRYDIKLRMPGVYDLMERAKHIYKYNSDIKSYSLNNFSKYFLGETKKDSSMGIWNMWKYDQKSLIEYNRQDALLVKKIDKKLNITGMMLLQCQWCRVLPRKFSIYQLLDSYIIQVSHALKRPVPTNERSLFNREEDSETDKYLGAEVLEPAVGVHDDVYVFDFNRLYPSIIMTFNIGFDTIQFTDDDDAIACAGTHCIERRHGKISPTWFSRKPSCIAEAVRTLVTKRDLYKKIKLDLLAAGKKETPEYKTAASDESIVKELILSVYGIMGMVYGRYYSQDMAESITLSGRWMLNFAKNHFEANGCTVLYGDTDSIFLKPDKNFNKDERLSGFHKAVEEELRTLYRCPESHIKLGFDKHFTRLMLFAKKKYAGHADSLEGTTVDVLYEKGMDYIKRNTFVWGGLKQKILIEDILRNRLPVDQVVNRIRQYKQEFFSKQFTAEELMITQRINKEEYKSESVIKQLVREIIETTGLNPVGSEIMYVITPAHAKKRGKTQNKNRGVLVQNYKGIYSREYYWAHKTQPLLEMVLHLISPSQSIDNYDLFLEHQTNLFGD